MRAHTLGPVIRLVTTYLVLLALPATIAVSVLHVHAYEGHDHPDHRHGPAAHSHEAASHHRHQDEGTGDGVRIQACSAGAHAVAAVFTCVASTCHQAPPVEAAVLVGGSLPPPVTPRVNITDVRAHSPPRLTDAPLRAPPLVHPA